MATAPEINVDVVVEGDWSSSPKRLKKNLLPEPSLEGTEHDSSKFEHALVLRCVQEVKTY